MCLNKVLVAAVMATLWSANPMSAETVKCSATKIDSPESQAMLVWFKKNKVRNIFNHPINVNDDILAQDIAAIICEVYRPTVVAVEIRYDAGSVDYRLRALKK